MRPRLPSPTRPRWVTTASARTFGAGGTPCARATSAACRSSSALLLITVFFQTKNDNFLTAGNVSNLIVQMAGTTTIAMGVVFVLLLGEIDLSIGYVSGIAGVVVAELQTGGNWTALPGWVAILAAVAVDDGDRPRSRARSSPSSAFPRSSSRSPACSPGRAWCRR